MPSISIGDIELHYVEVGQGPPVLFVHGFPLDHSMWEPQLAALAGRNRLLAPDLRGFGQSGVTQGTVKMEQYADDLASFLERLEIRQPVVLCGLSMGGYIAWQFWKRHGNQLAALILCDTRAGADTPETARGRLVAAAEVESQGSEKVVSSMLGKLFAEETAQTQPDLIKSTQQSMRQAPAAGVAAALRGMASREDMSAELAKIQLPTLVICGEHDAISRLEEMQQISDALPNSRFVAVPRAGHLSPLEQPQFVNQEVQRFLLEVAKDA